MFALLDLLPACVLAKVSRTTTQNLIPAANSMLHITIHLDNDRHRPELSMSYRFPIRALEMHELLNLILRFVFTTTSFTCLLTPRPSQSMLTYVIN